MIASGTLFLYVASMAFALLYGGFRKNLLYYLCAGAMAAGFALQTAGLTVRWIESRIIPATNLPQILHATAWALVALYLLFGTALKNRIVVFFLMPLVVLSMLTAQLIPDLPKEPKPFFYTAWFVVHIALLTLGIGLFLYSFLYSSIFIMQDHSLRHRRQPLALGLPSLEESARWATRFLLLGFGVYTAGLFSSGLYGALEGKKDAWRPGMLEVAAVAAWLILGAAIYGWVTAKLNPRKRAWLVVAGAASTVLIILGILWH